MRPPLGDLNIAPRLMMEGDVKVIDLNPASDTLY